MEYDTLSFGFSESAAEMRAPYRLELPTLKKKKNLKVTVVLQKKCSPIVRLRRCPKEGVKERKWLANVTCQLVGLKTTVIRKSPASHSRLDVRGRI